MQEITDQTCGSMEKVIQEEEGKEVDGRDDDDHIIDNGLCSKVSKCIRGLRAEPIMLFYTLGTAISSAFIQNVIIEKICLQKNHTREMCSGHLNETLEEEVQGIAAQYMMSMYVMRLIPAMVISVVIGHWSDLHGRRQILIFALSGSIITYVLYCVNAFIIESPPIYMVLATIPAALGGDFTIVMFGIFSIIRDTTSAANLIVKVAIVDGVTTVCWELGPLIGAELYSSLGYVPTFATSSAMHLACAMYVALHIKEPQFQVTTWKRSVLDFFDIGSFLKNVTVLTNKREGNRRAYICANLIGIMIVSLCMFGHDEIIYLFGRLVFGWDVVMYTYFTVYDGFLDAVALLIIMPAIVKCFKVTDTFLAVLGLWTGAAWFVSVAFVKTVRQVFVVRIIGFFGSFPIVAFRSLTLKCVDQTEIGKIAAVFSIAQTLGQIMGRVVSTQIYVATLDRFPGAFFIFCAGLSCLVGIIFGAMYWDIKRKKETDL